MHFEDARLSLGDSAFLGVPRQSLGTNRSLYSNANSRELEHTFAVAEAIRFDSYLIEHPQIEIA